MKLATPFQRLSRALERFSATPDAKNEAANDIPDIRHGSNGQYATSKVSADCADNKHDQPRRRCRQNTGRGDDEGMDEQAENRSPRVPVLSEKSHTVPSANLLVALMSSVPKRFQDNNLRLVYSTYRDGASLRTFYAACARCDRQEPLVLVVKDIEGSVFGAYTPQSLWRPAKEYYGNGETFVFTICPEFKAYKWSRRNSFFQLGSTESIAVGGGGSFAMFLDEMCTYNGSSGICFVC